MRNSALLVPLVLLSVLAPPNVSAAERADASPAIEEKLQVIVANLSSRLVITAPIDVSIVPSNALMMSVEAPTDPMKAFSLTVDASFLDTLSDVELEAAIAHELGHVWIFTHHPYLQTEALANEIAMRAVSRDSLERVYAKVEERGGPKGDLERFRDAKPVAAGLATDAAR